MIFISNKIIKLIKKNNEIFLLFLLILITVTSTTFYNNHKRLITQSYKDVINNIYFQKGVNQVILGVNNFLGEGPPQQNVDRIGAAAGSNQQSSSSSSTVGKSLTHMQGVENGHAAKYGLGPFSDPYRGKHVLASRQGM